MPGFNHYAKLARILSNEPEGWYIMRIDEPTTATKFNGEVVQFDHYYRLYSRNGEKIRYGKFQQIERLAGALHCDAIEPPIMEVGAV